VVALYYYANVIKQMYFAAEPAAYKLAFSIPMTVVVTVSLFGVIMFGLFPESVLQFARNIPLSYGFIPR
jgi:NADH:ubiquinone oxidoreductase subunit 2 (subunit N)